MNFKYETINRSSGTNANSNIYTTNYKCMNPTYGNGSLNEPPKASSHNTGM